MSMYICLVLCAVAVSLGSVYAGKDEQAAFREAIKPFIMECAKEYGISDADLVKAKDSNSANGINPCFFGCVFKKFEILNDKGEYDLEANLANIKKFLKNEDQIARHSEIAKKCESVNAAPVSDGAAGCERAILLSKCFMEHKSEIPM